MSERFPFSHAGAHRPAHWVSLGLGTTTYSNGVPTHNMAGMMLVPDNLHPTHASYHRPGGHSGGAVHRGPIAGVDTRPGGGHRTGGGPVFPRVPITPHNPHGIPGYFKPHNPIQSHPTHQAPPQPIRQPPQPTPGGLPGSAPVLPGNAWYRPPHRTVFGRQITGIHSVASPGSGKSLWQRLSSAWNLLGQHGRTFRTVISPTFDLTHAPAILVLPDVFRISAAHIAQTSLANATKNPPATGTPPQPVEVNRGIVIDNGVLQAIPGNVGSTSSVPPVNAGPGQEFIARLHVHPAGTPLDAQDLSFLWEPGAPRMTGVVVGGGTELGLFVSTRQSDAKKPSISNATSARVAFEKVMNPVEQRQLKGMAHPTHAQRNDARHLALAALAKAYGFAYYRGPVGGPMRLAAP